MCCEISLSQYSVALINHKALSLTKQQNKAIQIANIKISIKIYLKHIIKAYKAFVVLNNSFARKL